MSQLPHAKITLRPSSSRGHHQYGWLNTYHTFAFAQYSDPKFESFGCLRVLNEDRVAPLNGFPTHPHRDFEIFSYILSGELTHRDSMITQKDGSTASKNDFFRMRRGDVQFTTGGTGIAHSEKNEHQREEVHFLQIWATPWRKGLAPIYHTETFPENDKRNKFVTILSPLKAGVNATATEEKAAVPRMEGTIPIHADLLMGATIMDASRGTEWMVGGGGSVDSRKRRNVYVHLPMRGLGTKIRLDGTTVLEEGDGAYVAEVNAGDILRVENVGDGEAEVVVLDSN